MVAWETVRRVAAALPEVEERLTFGQPTLRVRGKVLLLPPKGRRDKVATVQKGK